MYLPGPLTCERAGAGNGIFLEYAILRTQLDIWERKILEPQKECLRKAKIAAWIKLGLSVIVAPLRGKPRQKLHRANDSKIANDTLVGIFCVHAFERDRRFVGKADPGECVIHLKAAVGQQ